MNSKRLAVFDNKIIDRNFKLSDNNQSFSHRICDDLCEEILRWLPIKDKLKFKAVSPQFERCLIDVVRKQKTLRAIFKVDLDDRSIFQVSTTELNLGIEESGYFWIQQLAHVLKTFSNIDDISIEGFPPSTHSKRLLETIADNCREIKSFRFDFNGIDQTIIDKFLLKFGPKLQVFVPHNNYKSIGCLKFLTEFPNIISLNGFRIDGNLWNNSKITTKKLKKLNSLRITKNCRKTTFDTIVNNCRQLTHLSVDFDSKHVLLLYLISKLSEFHDLEDLSICMNDLSKTSILTSSIGAIALNCNRLKSFAIRFSYDQILDINTFYESFRNFSNLNKLVLKLESNLSADIDLIFLKNCKKLTHLELRSNGMVDRSFNEIDKLFPYLKCLTIGSNRELTDAAFNSISKLKNLRRLEIYENDPQFFSDCEGITDSGLLSLINNCNRLQTIKINFLVDITENTFVVLIENSIKNQNQYFTYYLEPMGELDVWSLILNNHNSLENLEINGMTKTELIRLSKKKGISTSLPTIKGQFY